MIAPVHRHDDLLEDILLRYGARPDMTLWKNATGMLKTDERAVRFGLKGSADILGLWRQCEHHPGRFVAIEVKTGRGKLTKQQRRFAAEVERLGGVFLEARNTDLDLPYCERCDSVD